MAPNGIPSCRRPSIALAVLLGVLVFGATRAPDARGQTVPERLVVVDDQAYPPFAFLDGAGAPRGITVDLWRLWSRKTGIPVELRLMDWESALAAVREGRADVVGGIFQTPERVQQLDFTTQLFTIPAAVFFHRQIAGIKGLTDLAGFRVGVVKGDSAEELLRQQADVHLTVYPGADALVRDALAGHIKVFVADVPVAQFYLAQMPGGDAFRRSTDIQAFAQLAAVRKGQRELLEIVQQGLDRIEPAEVAAILAEWSGRAALPRFPWQSAGAVLALVLLLAGAAFGHNLLLRRRIAAATRSLTETSRELARSNESLQHSEEKFRTIFNNAPIGIFRTSFEGRLLEANATMARMLGFDSREHLLEAVTDLARDVYPTPGERRRLLDALIEAPRGVRMEIEFRRRDGSPMYAVINASLQMDAAGRPTLLNGTIEDITPLKHTEDELRRLAAAVEQSGEIVVITDHRGVIQYVNQAFVRITGYTRQEAVGRKPSLLKSGEHDAAFYAQMWQTLARGETWTGRLVNRRKDGARFVEEATISPVLDPVGKIVNYVAAKRDITHELALEEQSRQMQKMEAIGRLTGGVAHDFNNLLQAINGYTDLAVSELEPQGTARDFLHQARQAGQRAANLVQQLLLFSRRQIMQPKILDLNAAVADLLKMLGRILGEHIRIEWRPHGKRCILRADSGMLDQVLMNLCVNARDAMPAGGALTIATRPVRLDAAFCARHAWARPGRFVRLSVADTGCGMDRETLSRIFEPFFSTKGEGHGTGLGLATVYGIVRQHEGMIDVTSEPAQGSVFNVYLPLCEEEPQVTAATAGAAPPGGSETILLAEDDQVVRELALTILQRAGYTVLAARDGHEALALYGERGGDVALLLLDVVMPGLGGRAVLARIRERQPEIPALFASGYSEDAIHTGFVLEDGLSLIQKPYRPNQLLQEVRQALDRRPATHGRQGAPRPRGEPPDPSPQAPETGGATDP